MWMLLFADFFALLWRQHDQQLLLETAAEIKLHGIELNEVEQLSNYNSST